LLKGTQLILNPVYENVGVSAVNDDILRHLAVSQICQPRSKVATAVGMFITPKHKSIAQNFKPNF
jgi:hypothetical protein